MVGGASWRPPAPPNCQYGALHPLMRSAVGTLLSGGSLRFWLYRYFDMLRIDETADPWNGAVPILSF